MIDLYFQYVVWLNKTLINGIIWLFTNENAHYIFMCLIPIIAPLIDFIVKGTISEIYSHEERNDI